MPKRIDKYSLSDILAELEVMLVSVGATKADSERVSAIIEAYFFHQKTPKKASK